MKAAQLGSISAATLVHAAGTTKSCVITMSAATANVFIGGDSGVTSGTGFPVLSAATWPTSVTLGPGDSLYAISATGTLNYIKSETP